MHMPKSKHKLECIKCMRSISASAFMNHLKSNLQFHSDILEAIEVHRVELESEVRRCKVCDNVVPRQAFSFNEAMSHMHGVRVRIIEHCSRECSKLPWNTGLTKDANESLRRISESRRGDGNPIHKVLQDEVAKNRWIENVKVGKADYDASRRGKTLAEVYGKEKADAAKRNMSESAKTRKVHGHTGHKHTLETRMRIGQRTAEFLAKSRRMTSMPQLLLFESLQRLDVKFSLEHAFDHYSVDIAAPDIHLAIEVDGDFFHVNEALGYEAKYHVQKRNLQNDKKKQSHLIKSGWEVIRFWVSDIEKDVKCIVKQVESKIHTMRLSR